MAALKDALDLESFDVGIWKTQESINLLAKSVTKANRIGKVVFVVKDVPHSDPYLVLVKGLNHYNVHMKIVNQEENYQLIIANKVYADGHFGDPDVAKYILSLTTLMTLRNVCFFVTMQKDDVEIITQESVVSEAKRLIASRPVPKKPTKAKPVPKAIKKREFFGRFKKKLSRIPLTVTLTLPLNETVKTTRELLAKKFYTFAKTVSFKKLSVNGYNEADVNYISKMATGQSAKLKTRRDNDSLIIWKTIDRIEFVKILLAAGGQEGVYTVHVPKIYMAKSFLGQF